MCDCPASGGGEEKNLAVTPMTDEEIKVWRREQRARLLAARMAAGAGERRGWSAALETRLEQVLATLQGDTLGIYWPFKAEPDPRALAERQRAKGRRIALPVVVERKGPLEYRLWQPGMEMEIGVFDLPVPKERAVVRPDIVLAPLVGFDDANYRLGYGGGYFDRTLAALTPRPVAIGVGFELAWLQSVFPRPHDVAMDVIVTEARLSRRSPAA
jgi:5-formyltetrahydrofolate cyclo-ligase